VRQYGASRLGVSRLGVSQHDANHALASQ